MTKDAKDGKPVATEECEQVCAEILNIVDLKNVIFETQRKGKLTAEETKVKDAATEEKAAWILAKVTSIRAAIASMNISSDAGDTGDGDASKQAILKQLKELQQLIDFTVEDSLTKDVQIIRMNIELGRALELHGWELKVTKLVDESGLQDTCRVAVFTFSFYFHSVFGWLIFFLKFNFIRLLQMCDYLLSL